MKKNFDEIGYWSEIKLDIVKDYAKAYSTIMSSEKQKSFYHIYIDGFSGAGKHFSKTSKDFVPGSPLNALLITPPFREFHLIDLDGDKIGELKKIVGERQDVNIYKGDCNEILLKDIFPEVRYEDYRRGLCLLDPYGLHLNWEVIRTAGQLRTIDMFLNFPIMDMNRNTLWRQQEKVSQKNIERMNCFWGDESWRGVAYRKQRTLFGYEEEKTSNEDIAKAFQERLKKVAGFLKVPSPLPMYNSKGAVVYYLFFASQKPVAQKIVTDIFKKYRGRGS
ncbi:MAG: three-Cys-motif partner protein TcmP [Candidatus Aminicenantes bacterium]|nr:MAG: three-Cys-motif partner protein TcmP [Candidatus Aminicenantes bacterium]